MAGKEPSWTTKNQYNYKDSRLNHEAEDGYFDIAYEQQVSLQQQSLFCRKSIKILTEAGIQNSSEISVNFDPSYEQLTFHTIRIIRENTIIDQLEINLPEDWSADQSFNKINNASFNMTARFSHDGRRTIYLEYTYENLKDHVNPDEVKTYIAGLDERDKEFSYVLSYTMDDQLIIAEPAKGKKKINNNYYLGFFLLLVIGGIVWWTQGR